MAMLSNIKIHQWGGAAFMLGNLLFIVNKLNEMSRLFLGRQIPDVISGQNVLLIIIGQTALIVGYIAFYKLYAQRVGRYGRVALGLFSTGGVLLAVGHSAFISSPNGFEFLDFMFIFVLLGLAGLLLGLIWFGLANLRRPILGRWQWLPLATGLIGFIGFFLLRGAEISATFLVFRSLFALGLIGLGLSLLLEKPLELVTAP